MGNYMEPSIQAKPNHFILHVGTNDLNSLRFERNQIFYTSCWDKWFTFKQTTRRNRAKTIINLASELKSEKSVSISSIIMRADKPELNKKRSEVKHHLKEMCNRQNFFLMDHSKKIKTNHLNSSRLQLNRKGANILTSSLTRYISKVFNWQLSGNTSSCNVSELDFEENETQRKSTVK